MRVLLLAMALIAGLFTLAPVARADWDDSSPAWTDNNASQPAMPQARQALPTQTDAQWNPRQHTPQENSERLKRLEAQWHAQRVAQLRAAQSPGPQLAPGAVLPGVSSYHPQPGALSFGATETPFFDGLTRQQAADAISRRPYVINRDTSPDWAKQKVQTRQFQDGVEHFGDENSMGFF